MGKALAEKVISIHALLAESDKSISYSAVRLFIFLSTLSLRRATLAPKQNPTEQRNFYPRSPCGERRQKYEYQPTKSYYFYPRSPCGERL